MLTLDKATHIYYDDSGGLPVPVPSLSEVLRGGGVATDYSFIDPDVLERKRQIGEAVHSCIELYLKGELDEHSIDEAAKPYWDSFAMCDGRLPPLTGSALECPVGSLALGYACTPDLVASDKDFIIEWKTTSRLYRSVWIQLAGQAHALGLPDATRIAVVLRPGIKPIIRQARHPELHDVVFKSAFNTFSWHQLVEGEAA